MNIYQYFKNISFLFIINFGIKPIWVFLIERKFQLLIGQTDYGNYFSTLNIIYIYSVMLDLGLHTYTVKSISESSKSVSSSFYHLLSLKGLLILGYFVIIFLTIAFLQLSYKDALLLITIGFNQMLFSLFQFLRTFIQGMKLFKTDSWLSSVDRIFLILLGGTALLMFRNSISLSLFLSLHIISFFLCIIIAFYIIKKQSGTLEFHWSKNDLIAIIKQSLPLSIIAILMTLYTRIDGILLKHLIPDGDFHCGVYAFSYRFIDSSYNALYLLSIFLMPMIAYKKSLSDHIYIKKLMLSSLAIATVISLGFIIVSYFGAELIYLKLYKTTDLYSINTFKYGLLSTLGVGWMYIFGSYLTATERYKALISIVLLGLIINFTSNIMLIPTLKAEGAAISSSIVQLVMGLLHGIMAFYYIYSPKSKTT